MSIEDKKTILVVEDDPKLSKVVRDKLVIMGFMVKTARTVDEALKILEEVGVDAMWLDHYLLGNENGLTLVKKLGDKAPPVFVVSNTAGEDVVSQYKSLGVQEYFTKADFRLDIVISHINTYFKKHAVA